MEVSAKGDSLKKGSALGLSVLLHPLLMPTYFFIIIYFFSPVLLNPLTKASKENLIIAIFFTTFLIPLFITVTYTFLVNKEITRDLLMMNKRKQRFIPFFFIGTYLLGLSFFVFHEQKHPVIYLVLITIAALILITAIISLFWKISAHAVGISGITGFIITTGHSFEYGSNLLYPLLALIFISGILFSARLYLKAHTPAQVLAGYLLGLIVCGGSFILFLPSLRYY